MISTKGAALAAGAALLSLGLAAGPAAAAPAKACAGMLKLADPGPGVVITSAREIPAAAPGTVQLGFLPTDKNTVAIPAHCRVEGVIDGHKGADGKSYGLGFAIAMPDDWNGRFLMQGGGGLNGNLAPPLGPVAAGDRPALTRGFAVVSTDGGHKGAGGFDASFYGDQEAALDFAFKSVPTVTSAAKTLVVRYYGRPIAHAYFTGCSTGGREGMEAAERYPSLFDGIVTGAPAMRTGRSNLGLKWAAVAFNRISAKDPATGKLIPGGAFSPADRQLIVDGILKACDGLDGLQDGLISDVRGCHFDPAILLCKAAKADGCLSAGQVGALNTAFAGPTTPGGRLIYAAHAYDTGIAASEGIPGFLVNAGAGPVAGGGLPVAMDAEADAAAADADPTQQLVDTWAWTNLSGFYGHGGKQLFFHGVSDPWFSVLDTVDYYGRLGRDNGGTDKVSQSSRLFLIPGMNHCGGGSALDKFDLLTALVDWVEAGKTPDGVTATGAAFPGRSRPLCPYPQHAHYDGKGDPQAAASFSCRG